MEQLKSIEIIENMMDRQDDHTGKKLPILIVEDHEGMRNSMRRWLSVLFQDHDFFDVTSGEEAIEFCKTTHPQLVLLDIKLPGINGIEAARRIKTDSPITKIIILTIYDTPEFKKSALAAGADLFLSKNSLSTDLVPAMKAFCSDPTIKDR